MVIIDENALPAVYTGILLNAKCMTILETMPNSDIVETSKESASYAASCMIMDQSWKDVLSQGSHIIFNIIMIQISRGYHSWWNDQLLTCLGQYSTILTVQKTTTESSRIKPVEVMTMWWQDGNSAMDEILAVLAVRLSSCQVNRTIHVFRVWEKHLLINKNFVRLKYILPTDYTITGVKSPASPIFNRRGLETFQGDMNIHEAIGRNRDTFGWTSWIRMYSCKA